MTDPQLEARLQAIEARLGQTTPGPWYVCGLDDSHAMNLVAVATTPIPDSRWPAFDSGEIIAATLIQEPRYVDHRSELWNENAAFIAAAREDVPFLLGEIRRLMAKRT